MNWVPWAVGLVMLVFISWVIIEARKEAERLGINEKK